VLRESDYISNEESLKGIYLEMDTFMPSYTALVKQASGAARSAFINAIGSYLFYKKRYSARQTTAELLFNPLLVPGFNALFLDDSEAQQSFIAKLQAVTHNITNDGFSTAVELAYGRDFDEVDEITGGAGDPPTPPWFDSTVFGAVNLQLFQQETAYLGRMGAIDSAEVVARSLITTPTVFPAMSQFFQALLGCNSITNTISNAVSPSSGTTSSPTNSKSQIVSIRGAVSYLLYQYGQVSLDPIARDAKVLQFVSRPLAPILAAFDFIGAKPVGYNNNALFSLPAEFAAFTSETGPDVELPGRFDGTGYPDAAAVAARRAPITAYVKALRTQVGFRG
jgi:hypothetical protein